MEQARAERHLVRGPKGKWKIVPNRESAAERQHHLDRIALAGHLTGYVRPRLPKFP